MKKLLIFHLSFSAVYAQDSPHKNMTMDCGNCHGTDSWSEVDFDHDRTSFPLEERHALVDCQSCHNIEDFTRVESTCISCHQDVHEAKLGGDCQRCHNQPGWEVFEVEEIHADTRFPLMGAHNLVDCQSCHQNAMSGNFMFERIQCVDCHQQSYLAAVNPSHVENGFSTQCETCHEMNDWQPAFLSNHDPLFPIYSGEHDGEWSDCQDCHSNPATFTEFTCLTCHEHRQDEMDQKHQGIPGYAYESISCLSCHPRGEGSDFRDHDVQFFPIFSGTHAGEWAECLSCHDNPSDRKQFTCLTCHEHAQPEMDATHQGIPGYAYQSTDCLLCHLDGRKGEFADHDAQFFPIFSGKHQGEWKQCVECHNNPADRKEFTCFNCHEHIQARMDDKHLGKVQNYVYDSNACYDCHPNGTED